jgi:hypothetical protein
VCHGVLRIAETSSAPQKWTTFGQANAESVAAVPRIMPASEISVRTTNWRPVSAPAEEPTMT